MWLFDIMGATEFKRILEHEEEQLRILRYQNTRVLVRPKTRIIDVVFLLLLYFVLIACCIVLNCIVNVPIQYEVLTSILIYALITEFSLKYIGIKIVECYQHYATEQTRRKCLCVPSCSEYAILCLKKYELIYALIKIRKRLFITCKGYDFIIDQAWKW